MANLGGFRYFLMARQLAAPTMKNYLTCAGSWLGWCERSDVDHLKAGRNEMTTWLGEESADHAPSTVRLFLLSLRVFYDYLLDAELVPSNPARAIQLHKQVARPVEALSNEELNALLGACETHADKALILLLLGGGLRRHEVFSISRHDVNFGDGTIRVFGKGSKWRTVAPGQAAMKELRLALWTNDRLITQADDDYVWRRLQRLGLMAGIKGRIFPHRFRYTFAVEFSEAGGSVDLLQTILGHTSIEMSMHYSKQGRERRALKAQLDFNPADRLIANA